MDIYDERIAMNNKLCLWICCVGLSFLAGFNYIHLGNQKEHYDKELKDVGHNLNLQAAFINGLILQTGNEEMNFIARAGTMGKDKVYFPKNLTGKIPEHKNFVIYDYKIQQPDSDI